MGDFAQKNYLDRSLGAIGEKYQIDKVDKDLKDDDVEVIKGRIKNIRHKGNMSTILWSFLIHLLSFYYEWLEVTVVDGVVILFWFIGANSD